jgi:metallo-beta-lactamase family protein
MKTKGNSLKPLYTSSDVENALNYVRGYDLNRRYELDDNISFEFVPSGHIIGSVQIVLYIKEQGSRVHKILYTSDLGNIRYEQPFTMPFEPVRSANVVIGEATYALPDRQTIDEKARTDDMLSLQVLIQETCIEKQGRVLIPVFSLQRTQAMLKVLYELFHDAEFDIPIYVDSPLAVEMCRLFDLTLTGDDQELMHNILSWKNLRLISDADESQRVSLSSTPKVVLSSSGMCTAGRVNIIYEQCCRVIEMRLYSVDSVQREAWLGKSRIAQVKRPSILMANLYEIKQRFMF